MIISKKSNKTTLQSTTSSNTTINADYLQGHPASDFILNPSAKNNGDYLVVENGQWVAKPGYAPGVTKGFVFSEYDENGYPYKGEFIGSWTEIPDCYFAYAFFKYDEIGNFGRKITSVTIPSGVTKIGENAFTGCTSITSITIPNSVTSIGDSAFWDCTSLMNIIIPNGITTISNYTFSCCTSLTNVAIPNSVTSIGAYAFESCDSLTNITIPNSVTSIEHHAFYHCSSLENLYLSQYVTNIGSSAFSNCNNLTITVEANSYALQYCIDNNIPYIIRGQEYIAQGDIDNIHWVIKYNGDMDFTGEGEIPDYNVEDPTMPPWKAYKSSIKKLNVGINDSDNITKIGDDAFWACTNLGEVNLSNKLLSIGSLSLGGTNFTEIELPESLTTIGNSAFAKTALTSIYIPKNVNSIGLCILRGTEDLESLEVDEDNPYFASYDNDCIINKSTKTLISGTKNTVIPTDSNIVTKIGDSAFYYISYPGTLIIPDNITTIEDCGFYTVNGLDAIQVSNNVTSIGKWAFAQSEMSEINIPNQITVLKYSLFMNCYNLTSIEIPSSVTTIEDQVFYECASLSEIYIPSSVTSIGIQALETENENLIVYVEENSYAKQYCIDNNINYEIYEP